MTPEQQAHLDRIAAAFDREVRAKYAEGVRHHGGNLWMKGKLYFIEEAIKETIDQYVYLSCLRDDLLLQSTNQRLLDLGLGPDDIG